MLLRGRKHCPAREDPRLSQDSSRTLVKRRHRVVGEKFALPARDLQVMGEIGRHVLPLQGLKVAPADNPRREGTGGVVQQLVYQGGLSREHDREKVSRVEIHLGKRVELSEDIEPQEVGFVDHEDRDLLLCGEVGEHGADGREHPGD